MHPTAVESTLERWDQFGRAFDLRTLCTVTLGIFDKVRIPECQAEIRETIRCLLPADHAIRRIFQDQDDEIQLEADRGFHFLRVHHEAVIAEGSPAPMVASALSSSSVFATYVR